MCSSIGAIRWLPLMRQWRQCTFTIVHCALLYDLVRSEGGCIYSPMPLKETLPFVLFFLN